MKRALGIQLAAVVVCVGLIAAAASRMSAIDKGRLELNKMGSDVAVAQTPPEYAFFIQAFGAFRSLMVNIAFIRAEEFKEQGRYFDAMQLADWICTLQPYFPSVWEFNAWNQSWNISVTTFTPEERWRWVYNGVKLLRDRGIPYNPRAVNLYKQLAWTFVNKMSEPTDDQHYAYKCNWAWRMHLVLGPPPQAVKPFDPNILTNLSESDRMTDALTEAARQAWVQNEEKRRIGAQERGEVYIPRKWEDVREAEKKTLKGGLMRGELAKQAEVDFLRPIGAEPNSLPELFAATPETRTIVENLRGVGVVLPEGPLTEDEYWREGGLAWTFFQPYRRLVDPAALAPSVLQRGPIDDPVQRRAEQLDQALGYRAGNAAGAAVVRFLQKKILHDVYKMDTDEMIRVVELFGPVDWRSVDAEALYWVTKGLAATGESPNDFRNDKLNTARLLFFALRNLFLRNRIIFEPNPGRIYASYLNLTRDLNFVEPMHQAFLRYGPLFDPKAGTPGQQSGDAYRVGHENFLAEAIRLLYLSGRDEEAQHYYEYLQTQYPADEQGRIKSNYHKTLRDFVLDNFLDTTAGTPGPREASQAIQAMFEYGLDELSDGNVEAYITANDRARELYDRFMKDKNVVGMEAKRLAPFIDLQVDGVRAWLGFASPAPSPMDTLRKVRLWRSLPLYLRQYVYDDLLPLYKQECAAWGFDVARAFPEPRGLAEFRAAHPDRFRENKSRSDVEVETLSPKLGENNP